ncbi:hypothetical protein CLCR_11324 [Cladophialophora carrionii]|uniref:Uncharacterized protein n=1 Tax=Cladophialophora carrionii TaxID=86049 RepID=A0A1C1CJW8_9EURO|nr:hypothetical protein CLCR_11324 [Cladophialophora carrionii]
MDHTIIFQTITVDGASAAPAATGTSSILDLIISGLSSRSAAGQISGAAPTSAIPTNSTTQPTISLSTTLTLSSSLVPGTITVGTDVATPSSTPSELTTASTLSPIAPPSTSVYTTGIYIALGLFLFFGGLCALATSPAISTAVKAFFQRRTREQEQ